MLELKAADWYEVRGRGRCAYIDTLPEAFYKHYYSPQQLVNQHVQIDGKVFTVTGVERFMIACSAENPYHFPCGLMVKEYEFPSDHYTSNNIRRDSNTQKFPLETGV